MPTLPSIVAQNAGAAPRISPDMFGAQAFGELGAFGGQFQEIADKLQHAQDATEMNQLKAQYDASLKSMALELPMIEPDPLKQPAKFAEQAQKLQQSIFAQTKRDPVKTTLMEYARNDLYGQITEQKARSMKLGIEQQQANLDHLATTMLAEAAHAKSPAELQDITNRYFETVHINAKEGIINPVDEEHRKNTFQQSLQFGSALQDSRTDPIGTLEHLSERYPLLDAKAMETVIGRATAADARVQREAEKAAKAEKEQSVVTDAIAAVSGELSLDDLAAHAHQYNYTEQDYSNLQADIERGGSTNPNVLIHYETSIRTGQPVTFGELSGRKDLSNPDKVRLMGLLDAQSKTDHFSKTPVYEQAVKELRTAVSRKGPMESLDPQEQKTLLYTTQELWDRAAKGENPLTVARELIKRVPTDEGFGVGMPALLPKYKTEADLVSAFHQGLITRDSFNSEALLFKQLREKEAIQNAASQKQSLEKARTR
jgi:hypothetical protein